VSRDIAILYSAPMALATLDDSKTQTRRGVKWREPSPGLNMSFSGLSVERTWSAADGEPAWVLGAATRTSWEWRSKPTRCPYGQPGDRLWGRETFFAWGRWEICFNPEKGRDEWNFIDLTVEAGRQYVHAASGQPDGYRKTKRASAAPAWWKRPAIFMPRVASRLLMEVVSVRVERLQDISTADALAEGIVPGFGGFGLADGSHFHTVDPRQSYLSLWEAINGSGSVEANPWVWAVEFKRAA